MRNSRDKRGLKNVKEKRNNNNRHMRRRQMKKRTMMKKVQKLCLILIPIALIVIAFTTVIIGNSLLLLSSSSSSSSSIATKHSSPLILNLIDLYKITNITTTNNNNINNDTTQSSSLLRMNDILDISTTTTTNSTINDTSSQKVNNNNNTITSSSSNRNKNKKNRMVNVKDCFNKDKGPIPVLFLVHGRSGSSVTWQVLSNLSGYESKAKEIPGPSQETVKNFFWEKSQKHDLHGKWALKHLCALRENIKNEIEENNNNNNTKQKNNINYRDVIYGFQWKPYMDSIYMAAANGTFQLLSKLANDAMNNDRKTLIRILRSRRNPIDVTLSNLKHKLSEKMGSKLRPYCASKKDVNCIERHKRLGSSQFIENVTEFFNTVQNLYIAENEIDDMLLNHYHIPTYIVSYEDLFYPNFKNTTTTTTTTTNNNNDNNNENELATEWNKIFEFAGSSKHDFKMKDIWNAMKIVATTTSLSHKDRISNYDEVYNVFKGTNIEFLLRP